MPIYEYVCGKCAKKTEVIQGFKAAPPKVCPHCGGRLKKAFSAPAIQFKGSGFYITDYAKAKQEGGKSGKDSEGGGDSGPEKSDAGKPAEKPGKSEKSADAEKPAKGEKTTAKSDKKKT